jgi:uncharacterized membrane protein
MIILSLAAPSGFVFAAKQMRMQASLNPTETEQGVTVVIMGRVFDTSNTPIPNAAISIQVNNPQGTSVHIAVNFTDSKGLFQDTFFLLATSPGGNYTVFLVSDKPGYDTTRVMLIFSYSSPNFSIQISASALSLRQGETSSVTLTILALRGFHELVNLTALALPMGITVQFNPTSIVPSGTVAVIIAISSFAPVGNHTVTLLGVSGFLSHRASLQVGILPGSIQAIYFPLALVVIFLGVVFMIARYRREQKRREAVVESLIKQASADKGYVASARALAKLEELRATDRVDEATYERLRKEYEKQLEKSR